MYWLDYHMTIVMLNARTEEKTMGPRHLARLLAGRVHYAWIVVGVMFTVILATVGVRAAPGVLIVPLEQAFGWDAGDDLRRDFAQYPAGRAGRAVRRGADPADRHARHGAEFAFVAGGRRRRRGVRDPAVGALRHLGCDGRRRLGRRHGRHGDRGGESLVRRAARPGGRAADREQRQRPACVPAAAGEPGRASRLAEPCRGWWRW